MNTTTDTIEEIDVDKKVFKPSKWAVVLHNDETTPFEFVVHLLMTVFELSKSSAFDLTSTIHQDGKGIAGIYAKSGADARKSTAEMMSQVHNIDLKITLEPK